MWGVERFRAKLRAQRSGRPIEDDDEDENEVVRCEDGFRNQSLITNHQPLITYHFSPETRAQPNIAQTSDHGILRVRPP
jgi:hypothetical protein